MPPIALGIVGFMWMTQPREAIEVPKDQVGQAVRYETVTKAPVKLTATGYGRVNPVREWSAVSQVDGRITEILQNLAEGAVVDAGTLLVQIDPKDFELAISKTQANISAAKAGLAEIDRQEENANNLMAVEQRSFDVAQAEFDRIEKLFERGSTTGTALDAAKKTLLAAENSMVNLTNTLALFPTQRATAQANVALREAELREAQRSLENTKITAPFRGRVSSEAVENGQFVRTGNELLSMVAIDRFEVVGAFTPRTFGTLVRAALQAQLANISQLDATQAIARLQDSGASVFVAAEFADGEVRYPATLTRFRGTVDDETGTVGLAVRVDNPLMVDTAVGRPPLEIGTFVSVHLETAPTQAAISIPRAAVRQSDDGTPFVYTAGPDNSLTITPVELGPIIADRVVVSNGLSTGDRLILSTPRPPIEGLPLTLVAVDGASQ